MKKIRIIQLGSVAQFYSGCESETETVQLLPTLMNNIQFFMRNASVSMSHNAIGDVCLHCHREMLF